MRAYAAVAVFASVAVHTENLESRREVMPLYPLIKRRATLRMDTFFPHFVSVVVDVIYRQKQRLGFIAAYAAIAAVGFENRIFRYSLRSESFVALRLTKLFKLIRRKRFD